jgi:cell division protein FtsN
MIEMNKDIMMMVAIAVVLFATFYLYKETQKNKLEIDTLKNTPPPPPPPVAPPPKAAEPSE